MESLFFCSNSSFLDSMSNLHCYRPSTVVSLVIPSPNCVPNALYYVLYCTIYIIQMPCTMYCTGTIYIIQMPCPVLCTQIVLYCTIYIIQMPCPVLCTVLYNIHYTRTNALYYVLYCTVQYTLYKCPVLCTVLYNIHYTNACFGDGS